MLGVIVDTLAILVAGLAGTKFGSVMSKELNARIMQGIGLTVLMMGISGALEGKEPVIMIISMILGIIIGESLDLDQKIKRGIDKLQERIAHDDRFSNIGPGFISGMMIFCIGSMALVGALEAGLLHNNTTLYVKALLDGITAFILSSSLGIGVPLGAIPVLLIEGGLVLAAAFLEPFLGAAVITEIVTVGSILLIGLALNILEITDLKMMNFLPAMLIPVLLQFLYI